MSFLKILGKRFCEAGLQDLMVESAIVASGSINGVLSGHNYNRSIRCHKIVYEALERLRIEKFCDTLCPQKRQEFPETSRFLLKEFHDNKQDFSTLFIGKVNEIQNMYQQFVAQINETNVTANFWGSYIDAVQLLLTFIRATRESDWALHLATVRKMLKWFFAYDMINYARYLTVYWCEMSNLPKTLSYTYENHMIRGKWTVQRNEKYGFSSIACDQAIEQTINRDAKTEGGIRGITMNQQAVLRWILAQSERCAITRQCEYLAGINHEVRISKDLDDQNKTLHQKMVQSVLHSIEAMINPFEVATTDLISISTGLVANDSVKRDLQSAPEKGEAAANDFIKNRLTDDRIDIFNPIKKMKLKTFKDMSCVKSGKINSKVVDLKHNQTLFARLLVIAQSRKINVRHLLTFSLGAVSYSLANSDGSPAKTNKADLLHAIEELVVKDCIATTMPPNGALVVDGMAVIYSISKIPATFGELAHNILQILIDLGRQYQCQRLDIVFNVYKSRSIKDFERTRRMHSGSPIIKIVSKDQPTPKQWKKFLGSSSNKNNLIEFLLESWKTFDFKFVGNFLHLYITSGSKCFVFKICNGSVAVEPVEC